MAQFLLSLENILMDMEFERKLSMPIEVKAMYSLTAEIADTVEKRKAEIKSIIDGTSDKMLLIIGPCSADMEDSVVDYISRLCAV